MAVTPEAGNDPIRNEPLFTGTCPDEQGKISQKLVTLRLSHFPIALKLSDSMHQNESFGALDGEPLRQRNRLHILHCMRMGIAP